jgi:hypothetical protein
MAKLVLNAVSAGFQSNTAVNANNALIEAAIENTVSLDGTSPNAMNADFDLNNYNLLNVNKLNGLDLTAWTNVATAEASVTASEFAAAASAAAALVSQTAAEAAVTGDIGLAINGATDDPTPADTDLIAVSKASVLNKLTWANLKSTLYNAITGGNITNTSIGGTLFSDIPTASSLYVPSTTAIVPSKANEITIYAAGIAFVSWTSPLYLQIGSGALQTTGYNWNSVKFDASPTYASGTNDIGFLISNSLLPPGIVSNVVIKLTLIDSSTNTWSCVAHTFWIGNLTILTGSIVLPGVLTDIALYQDSGFSHLGTVTIAYR